MIWLTWLFFCSCQDMVTYTFVHNCSYFVERILISQMFGNNLKWDATTNASSTRGHIKVHAAHRAWLISLIMVVDAAAAAATMATSKGCLGNAWLFVFDRLRTGDKAAGVDILQGDAFILFCNTERDGVMANRMITVPKVSVLGNHTSAWHLTTTKIIVLIRGGQIHWELIELDSSVDFNKYHSVTSLFLFEEVQWMHFIYDLIKSFLSARLYHSQSTTILDRKVD